MNDKRNICTDIWHFTITMCTSHVDVQTYKNKCHQKLYVTQMLKKISHTNIGLFLSEFPIHAVLCVRACLYECQAINLYSIFNKSSDQFWIKFPLYIVRFLNGIDTDKHTWQTEPRYVRAAHFDTIIIYNVVLAAIFKTKSSATHAHSHNMHCVGFFPTFSFIITIMNTKLILLRMVSMK